MVARTKGEPFPPISANTAQNSNMLHQGSEERRPSRRRTSSTLGGDPRGDTGVGGLATRGDEFKQTASSITSSSTSSGSKSRTGKRRKARTLLSRFKRTCLKHTWTLPLLLLSVLVAAYYVYPGEHNPLHHALFISYANPPLYQRTATLPAHIGNPTQYGKGRKDFAFVAFYIIVFSFTREFLMQRLLRPLAIRAGLRSRAKQARFMEQFYTAIYFGIFGPFGLFVMSRTPVWFFNIPGMYQGFPHRAHDAYFKTYYLLQAAYWAQQAIVLVLQLEAPRKDYRELVLHHHITLALIGLSYRFHFTYIGVAIYITMDISDFFLATAKLLNYLDSPITAPYFGFFLLVWAYLRHYINLLVLVSMLPGGTFQTVGPYLLNWDTQQYKCWISQWITFALLASLQAVNLFWFFLILRILWRILFSGVRKDDRSEDEEEEEGVAEGEGVENPTLLVNGAPMSPVGGQMGGFPATGVESREGEARKR